MSAPVPDAEDVLIETTRASFDHIGPERSTGVPSPDPPNLPELRLLDQAVVDDDAQLAAVVDALVHQLDQLDPEIATLHRELLAAQVHLRALAPEPVWLAYLGVEQAMTARSGELLLRVFKAGFSAGAAVRSRAGS